MEVYIEFVILDNLIINFLLLYLVNYTLKLNAKKWMMITSSVFGTIVAIILPLFYLNNYLLMFIKIILGIIMVMFLCNPKKLKVFVTCYFLFLTYTFMLGGMCYGVLNIFNIKTTFSGILLYNLEIPMSVFIVLILMYLKLLFSLIKNIKNKFNFQNFYYDVKISDKYRSVNICGFLDSGNQIEQENGVVVINYKTFLKLYPNINYQKIITGDLKNCGLTNAKFINVGSAVSKNKMLVFDVMEMLIIGNGKTERLINQTVGLAKTNFNKKFDCLLSPKNFVRGAI